MQATKNNTKEETIRKFKQLLKHKQEMLERAKQYDGIDIYAKFANAWKKWDLQENRKVSCKSQRYLSF